MLFNNGDLKSGRFSDMPDRFFLTSWQPQEQDYLVAARCANGCSRVRLRHGRREKNVGELKLEHTGINDTCSVPECRVCNVKYFGARAPYVNIILTPSFGYDHVRNISFCR